MKKFEIIEDYQGYSHTTGAWVVAPDLESLKLGVDKYMKEYPIAGYGTHEVGTPRWNEPKKNYWLRMSRLSNCE